jgi:prepilin-type N-terminal cleavage/methylation domain-containing protein
MTDATRETASRNAGFTLIEVMIALSILSIGLLGLGMMQLQALRQGSQGRHSVDAAALARTHLEMAHRLPWADLSADAGMGWANPAWAGATPSFDLVVDAPGPAATAVNHSYGLQWRVTEVGMNGCLRDVEVQVSWNEEQKSTPKLLTLGTRRYNWGDPSC